MWFQVVSKFIGTSLSFASSVSALDAQDSFVALGSDPAKHFKHAFYSRHLEVPLVSIVACSPALCWTVALDASVQNVKWGCPANAVCMFV